MGVIVLGLVIAGRLPAFVMPGWVVLVCAGVMALGTALGGWRLIRTLGGKFYKVRPVHSFTAQFSSALVMLAASLLGWPVSTAQVVSSAIVGVGAAERISKVRWGIAGEILAAWLLTIPATALLASAVYWVMEKL
jgi:PiT family inorganic phosphate transporter